MQKIINLNNTKMKNIKEFLKEATVFQGFCERRGYELLMSLGCKWKMYKTPDKFEFEEDGVIMTFQEDTRHDCPDYETIYLMVEGLEKTDEDWALYIENAKKETAEKERFKLQNEESRELQEKERQFERLKKELGR